MTTEIDDAAASEAAETGDVSAGEGSPPPVEEVSVEEVSVEEREAPSTEDAIEGLQRDLEATRERLLRSVAEFENYKKRHERERRDFRRLVAAEILRDYLTVVDNLQLAVAAEGSLDDLKSGVELILQQMGKLLERFGVKEIIAEGEPFDPSHHEAIARFEDPSVSEPVVAEELQRGYTIDGRLLRPAMVRVAVPAETDSAADGD